MVGMPLAAPNPCVDLDVWMLAAAMMLCGTFDHIDQECLHEEWQTNACISQQAWFGICSLLDMALL